MGSKRVGLARTQALLQALKRDLTLGSTIIKCDSVIESLENTDEDSRNSTLSAAEFKQGLVTHTSATGEGTITLDTAANLIETLGLTADGMTAHCYYVNDGDQNLVFGGSPTGISYADTGSKIKENQGAIVLARRTGAAAVTIYVIGAS
jgi:hypothetical protein